MSCFHFDPEKELEAAWAWSILALLRVAAYSFLGLGYLGLAAALVWSGWTIWTRLH
jgi:hypothetical protein